MSTSNIDLDKEIDDVLESSEKSASTGRKSSKKGKKEKDEAGKSKMDQLLDENPVTLPELGEKITGKVIEVDSRAIYVDLGMMGTGIVYGKEIKDGFGTDRKKIKAGDDITAAIIDWESDEGYIELSISEAVREQAWNDLAKKRDERVPITIRILDANKGGLMVEVNGITGFMPVSQLTAEHYPRVEDGDKNKILEILKSYVGTEMVVCVLDIDEAEDKLIVSEKEAHRDKEKDAVSELKVGDVIEGEASGVVDFGAFVKFLPPSKKSSDREEDKLEGLVHISQLDWQLIDDPRKIVKVGDKVRAKIISIDDTRISLSIRELKNDPWEKAAKKYKIGDLVKGKVHKINHFGAFVYLDKDIHGLAHVSSFPGYPDKAIDEIAKIGDEYSWEIMSMEPNEHRMGLKFSDGKKKKDSTSPKASDSATHFAKATKVKKATKDRSKSANAKEEKMLKKETKKAAVEKKTKATVRKTKTKKVSKSPGRKTTKKTATKKLAKKVAKKKPAAKKTKKATKKASPKKKKKATSASQDASKNKNKKK